MPSQCDAKTLGPAFNDYPPAGTISALVQRQWIPNRYVLEPLTHWSIETVASNIVHSVTSARTNLLPSWVRFAQAFNVC